MAEEKQIGIPQEPLDYSSELATRPYELDADKKYEAQRHAVGNESLRRAVVGNDWKISKATAPTQFFTGLGQGVESIISEAIPKSVVKWGTDPAGATAGAVVGTTGYSVGSRVAGKTVSNIAPKLLSGAVKLAGGVTGALGLATIFDPTPIATQEEETTSLKNFILKDAETKLETAKTDLSQGKITQEEYDTAQTQYDKAVQTVKRVGEYAETYDEVVDSLDGIAYPSESFADSAVSGASRLLQAREELQALRNAKKGIDPESPWYKAGNVLGNVAVYGGSAVLGNQIARYGVKGTVKRALIDEETKKGAEMLSAVKPVRSRKEAQELAENIVKGTTAEIESASYVWENARDYIEKTGDTTLSEFTPKDAKTLSAAAYGAIAGEIEVMGGVEALATGAFRDLGLISAGKAIAKTVIGEGGEEATQTFTEYLSRRIDGTTDKTIGEALKDSLNSFVWGGFGGIVPGTIGHLATRHARNQGVKILQDYGLSRDTAEKVFDKMADTVADANNPQMETVRDNLRSKVSAMYEDIDMPVAEKEDVIDATTDLEMSWLMTEATENGYAPEESPLLQGVVNEIGYFRTGIPEQISEDVERLNNEIKDLRERLKEEQAKETKDYEKIDSLESKIEQFFAKLPQDIAKLVETDRQRIREMLSEQSSQLKDNQARKQLVRKVRERAIKAMQKQDETELQKSLRRLEEQTKTEEQKAREAEREQKKEQRKIRKAVEKLRTKLLSRTVAERVMDEDLFYDLLLQNGYTNKQIAKMTPRQITNAYNKILAKPSTHLKQSELDEQFDLADENARLDDIYPEYTGETIEVDGKERTVYNSNGDRIAKSKEALTNFWRWFGDSKVVDEQGRPLVVYHFSSSKFNEFDRQFSGRNNDESAVGFWFADREDFAFNDPNKRPEKYAVYLNAKNPKIFEGEGTITDRVSKAPNEELDPYTQFEREINKLMYEDPSMSYETTFMSVFGVMETVTNRVHFSNLSAERQQEVMGKIISKFKEQGYDGVIIKNTQMDTLNENERMNQYVAFEPNQIKSVDNRGTYSSDTGNIYYQSEESEASRLEMQRKFANNYFEGFMVDIEQDGLGNFVKGDGVYKQTIKSYPPIEINSVKGQYAAYDPVRDVISISVPRLKGMSENQVVDYIKEHKEDIRTSLQHEYKHFYDIAKGASVSAFKQRLMNILPWMYYNNQLEADAFTQEFLSQLANQFNSLTPQAKQQLLKTGRDTYVRETYKTILRKSIVPKAWNKENTATFKKRLGEQFDMFKENPNRTMYQNKATDISGKGKQFRGAYIPEYRFIVRTQNMDASTLSHELAHDWMQQYFRHYRSGKASPEFMKSWGAVEKALGISPDEINVPEKASEAFARAYEGWIMNKRDWAKNIAVDDSNREDVIKTLERYQEYITDVYNDLTNPYFRETWGEVGELKPELKAWFDQVTLAEDAVAKQVETGKITPQQATAKIIDKIVEKSEDTFTEKEKAEIETVNRINDTSRYEVEGGNKNSLQKRLSGLAQSMDSNNAVLGRYETRRDMLEVAKAADEFVRTRRDEAMDIINGIKPETEGLYASDLYTALERLAVENNDVDLAMELVNSKVATELAKELGQRVAGFRNFNGNGDFDVISQLKSLDQKFKKDYDKNGKAQVEEATDDYVKELKKADSEQDVDNFLKSIECQ